ncbi:MAG: IS3 family transposase [Chlamydiae bacterium]|nr:IS3 family transposase [Chlamydiota bacterium]
MELIDREYVRCPFFGSHQMTASLRRRGYPANRKRVMKLMQKMGIEAIYSKLNLSKAAHAHKKYPYLLKGKLITESDEVWATDITYIPLRNGYLYLVVIMD